MGVSYGGFDRCVGVSLHSSHGLGDDPYPTMWNDTLPFYGWFGIPMGPFVLISDVFFFLFHFERFL